MSPGADDPALQAALSCIANLACLGRALVEVRRDGRANRDVEHGAALEEGEAVRGALGGARTAWWQGDLRGGSAQPGIQSLGVG